MIRKECAKPFAARGRLIGGKRPLICVPLMAGTADALCQEADKCLALQPDILEWRVDFFTAADDLAAVAAALAALRRVVGDTPLIFTCRDAVEGGARPLSVSHRFRLMMMALTSGQCDLLDAELAMGEKMIAALSSVAAATGVGLILSFHDFAATADEAAIFAKLKRARDLGAAVAKVAVTPKKAEDLLTLFAATCRARRELDIPLITMAMGRDGRISRIAGGLFGSDITFAAGRGASAPGQIAARKLREAMKLLYPAPRKEPLPKPSAKG
ncbi:MAG: type I 3-dehydroquinate dehydratase [Desulfobulbaceae bacterium]|jgi:3-dehydroquinate dehydratase-1|nr:type I 3-dehydroquinate dehydratase [Desulfobulbaceae bacterium]